MKEAANENANYVHCYSHVLNLAIASAIIMQDSIYQEANWGDQQVFIFFVFSPKCQTFLEKNIKTYYADVSHSKLPGLCKTTWVEHHTCLELYDYTVVCLSAMAAPADYPEVKQQDVPLIGTEKLSQRHKDCLPVYRSF